LNRRYLWESYFIVDFVGMELEKDLFEVPKLRTTRRCFLGTTLGA